MIAIGTSGWSYGHWTPQLYPPGLPARDRLARYTDTFATAELNSSFYRWPTDTTFRGWHDRLPAGFALSVKAPRGLTHAKKLYQPETWVERIARAWHELGGPDHNHLYAGSYSDAELSWWRDRIREWESAGRDVYAYFNNDGDANAVRNALQLRAMLS